MFTLAGLLHAEVVINELHYDPDIATEDVEFVELFNTGGTPVDLGGWRLKGGIDFAFAPGATIATGGYLVICQDIPEFATKFGFSPLGPYSGRLNNDGDGVELVDAVGDREDQVTYQLGFPWPTVGDAPGSSIELTHPTFDNSLGGSWRASSPSGPTPGARNSVFTNNIPPQIRQVEHSPSEPRSGEAVLISAKVTDSNGVSSVTLQYQLVNPGAYISTNDAAFETTWTSVAMNDLGTGGDAVARDDVYSVELAAGLQVHRRLVRYRVTVTDGSGKSLRVPYADDPQPNFAYFVYDGVPAWQGSIQPGSEPVVTYSSNEMSRLPTYHLISKKTDVETSTWFERYRGDEYKWPGTLVYDGVVYDHVHYRSRGGVWRYAMAKNMWKVALNRGHELQARDNWGNKYPTLWRRLNLGASIQQGDFNHRGEQGMFEAVGHRLFDLAGADSPNTAFCTFRIVDEAGEVGPNQFEGDFWGVYLAVEQLDGRYLEGSGLPDGNLYKMENGTGAGNGVLANQGPDQPGDNSDLESFVNGYNSYTDQQWRDNMNLPKYYSYQAMAQAIHHYDICCGKNYYFFHDPVTGKWETLPWDFDLTWADNMFVGGVSGGTEPFRSLVLSDFSTSPARPAIYREFQNRVREIRDLLYNTDQAHRLIDEYTSILRGTNTASILAADRAMWDYNPKMTSSTYSTHPDSKAGQGRFYQAGTPTRDFAGMVQLMKDYVVYRGGTAYLSPAGGGLDGLARDTQIPSPAVVTSTGPGNFPVNKLTFRTTAYSGSNPFAAWKWRIAEVTPTNAPASLGESRKYEIEANWESPDITDLNALDISIPGEVVRPGRTYRVRVRSEDTTGRRSHWSPPLEFTSGEPDSATALLANLRVSELMFDSPAGSEFDFVEVQNRSMTTALDLGGAKFTQGIDYTFPPGTVLAPGGYLAVAKTNNVANFRSHYGLAPSIRILGGYDGNFSNGGESVVLRTSVGGTDIVAFTYSDDRGWPVAAGGSGHSLVPLVTDDQTDGRLDYGGHWRASAFRDGSPGRADPTPPRDLLLNEFMAHTDYSGPDAWRDANDWIELFNASTQSVAHSNWYLSDTETNLTLWPLPPGGATPPGGFALFDEVTGFRPSPTTGFGLSKDGERLFLSYLPGDGTDRVADATRFKAQRNDISEGRHPDGGAYWSAMSGSPGTPNASALAGVVIAELMVNPAPASGQSGNNTADEYVKLYNPTALHIDLWFEGGPCRLGGVGAFTFPPNTSIPAGGSLLVVPFAPADTNALRAFTERYALTEAPGYIHGPFTGELANRGERIALECPQWDTVPGGSVSWAILDEVIYATSPPWPANARTNDYSLHRVNMTRSGNDPANWTAQPAHPLSAPPSVVLIRPEADALVRVPSTISAEAVVNPNRIEGDVHRVDFFLNGTPAATDAAAPFTAALTHVHMPRAGEYRLRADVVHDGGTNRSVEIVLHAVWGERITLLSPADDSRYIAPFSDALRAAVNPEFRVGDLHAVRFLAGTNVLGSLTAPPFEIAIDQVAMPPTGWHELRAVLDDDFGASTSAAVRVFVCESAYADWNYRMRIGIPGYGRNEVLRDFPLAVALHEGLPGFRYADFASPTGGDLRFTDATGTNTILHEIERWDPAGTSWVWVRMPELRGAETALWAYWGHAAETNPPAYASDGAVWSPAHKLVLHMAEGTGLTAYDATSNRVSALSSHAVSWAQPGAAGGAAAIGTRSATWKLGGGGVPMGESWTLSLWIKDTWDNSQWRGLARSQALHRPLMFSVNSDEFSVYVHNLVTVVKSGSSASFLPDRWQHLAVVGQGTGTTFFLDGVEVGSCPSNKVNDTLTHINGIDGFTSRNLARAMDEIRFEQVARSANWLWACWRSQSPDGGFLAYAPAEPQRTLAEEPPDADGNGLPDAWETLHFGTRGIDPHADDDEDGASSFQEYIAGTDPNDDASRFAVAVEISNHLVVVRVPTVSAPPEHLGTPLSRRYALDRAWPTTQPDWQGVPGLTNQPAGDGDADIVHTNAPGAPAGFFRARVWLDEGS